MARARVAASWPLALLSGLLVLPILAQGARAPAEPSGEYVVVATRLASDVATTPDFDRQAHRIGQRVSFEPGHLVWLDGATCGRWSARAVERSTPRLEDPNLSDLRVGPVEASTSVGDRRLGFPVELVCLDGEERVLDELVVVDGRVLVVADSSGRVNFVLEKPLARHQIVALQSQLRDMKFHAGRASGELDPATLRAVALYAEYRGAKYRFRRAAITENLLDGLGVLKVEAAEDRGAPEIFTDYVPKLGAARLQDYSPQFAPQIDALPTVTFDNLRDLLAQLNSMTIRASKLPGRWVEGDPALGAEPREYAPSHAEIMAAALGDRILDFVTTADAAEVARRWPEGRDREVRFHHFHVRSVDVMGSGRFYYASAPVAVSIEVPEPE